MNERIRVWALWTGILLCMDVAQGRVWYVDDDALAFQDGSSWRTAFRTLNQALFLAEDGDIIRMAQGRYTPADRPIPGTVTGTDTPSTSGGGREGDERRPAPEQGWFVQVPLTITGGYAGVKSADPNQRDPQAMPTVLSGDVAGDDVEVKNPVGMMGHPHRIENVRTLFECQSLTSESGSVLDGLTLSGATASAVSVHSEHPLRVRNCIFQANSTEERGGALHIMGAEVLLVDCVLRMNAATQFGGAVYADGTPESTRRDPMLVRCQLTDNWAGQRGGAIAGHNTLLNLRSCLLSQNRCGQEGGALYAVTSPVTVSACTFRGNEGGIGGALYVASGVCSLDNTVLSGNRAEDGHALAVHGTFLSLDNCTLTANVAKTGFAIVQISGRNPGPFPVHMAQARITNCILWNEGRELSDQGLSPEYSCIQGWQGGGEGVISTDPGFADPLGTDGIPGTEDDDLRLMTGSPCINAGAHSGSGGGPTQDLDGRPRVLGFVDMGAYEFGRIWHVDTFNGDATRRGPGPEGEGLTPDLAYPIIQMALDRAEDGDTVLVHPGEYYGFQIRGKSIEVRGVADTRGVPMIESGIEIQAGARQPAVVSHLVIRSSEPAVRVRAGAKPLLQHLTVVENTSDLQVAHGAAPVVRNCIFHENGIGDLPDYPVSYCCSDRFLPGVGNIIDDPLFVDPEGNDYRLFSEGGRYSPFVDGFVYDIVTSPCIDAGDPRSDIGEEPSPNGWRVNLGAYGGTRYASRSLEFGPWVVLTEPAPNAEIQGFLDLEAWASAVTRVVAVQFFIDDIVVDGDESRPGVWTAYWNPAQSGYVTVMAVAMDTRGHLAVSAPVTVTVTSAGSEGGRDRR